MVLARSGVLLWRAKGIPLPPEVVPKLRKFREGIPTPRMVDELAGSSLAVVGQLSTSPRYICNGYFGPLWFHHLIYSLGSRGPHQPIVFRRFLKKPLVERQEVELVKDRRLSGPAPTNGWVDLPPATRLLAISFANGTQSSWQWLRLDCKARNAAPRATPTAKKQASSLEERAALEPWRVGVALDPYYRSVVHDVPAVKIDDQWWSHLSEESFIAVTRPVQLNICVPPEVTRLCQELNKLRRSKQASEGHFAPHIAGAASGTDSSEHTVRLAAGDVCFVPAGWKYAMYHTQSATTDLLTRETSLKPQVPTIEDLQWTSAFRIGYAKYPQLSSEQAARYIAADYVVSHLDTFYREGGNNPHKEYQ